MTLSDDAVIALTTVPPVTADVKLILRPVADPIERDGRPARHPDYRLKLLLKSLLRGYGFRCVSVGPAALADIKPAEVPPTKVSGRKKAARRATGPPNAVTTETGTPERESPADAA